LPSIKKQKGKKMIENVRQSERDILEVIRDLDRQDDANTDTIDIIKSAE